LKSLALCLQGQHLSVPKLMPTLGHWVAKDVYKLKAALREAVFFQAKSMKCLDGSGTAPNGQCWLCPTHVPQLQ
jgi:hypothetical protein